MNMFTDAVMAIDGSKFKAVNAKKNNFTPQKAKDHIARVESNISEYLSKLDSADTNDKSDKDTALMKDKLAWLKNRLSELQEIENAVNAHPDKQISLNDPDARLMKTDNMNRQVCYNVQTAVDTKHHPIVSHDITMSKDMGQLSPVTAQVQEALNRKDITVIADKGYFSRDDIKAAKDLGAMALVPQTDTSGSKNKGIFNKSLFKYDKDKDIYTCPAGEVLPHRRNVTEDGLEQKVYVNHIACRDCTIRAKCTTSLKEPRKMKRWIHEHVSDAMQQRLDDNPDIPVLRKQTVEHPFGTIKMMGATHFLMRRKKV